MDYSEEINRRFLLQEEYLGNDKIINKIEPLVSVIVASYQHEEYIRQCLDSILEQKTNFLYEIIVGEDDSKDNTRSICIEYAEKYPNKIRLFLRDREVSHLVSSEGKLVKRLNGVFGFGRMSSRGKYIAVCEGDDYWVDSLKLQKQFDFMEVNKDCSIVFHPANCINSNNEVTHIHGPQDKQRKMFFSINEAILNSSTLVPTNAMFFKSKYVKVLPSWFIKSPVGDIPMLLLLSHNGKIGFIDETMSVYRVMSPSSWTKKMQFNKDKRVKLFNKSKEMWQNFDEWSEFKYTKIVAKNNKKNKLLFMINEFKIRFPFLYSILKKPFLIYKKRLL